MNADSTRPAMSSRHASPPLGILAVVYVILKIASVVPVSTFGSRPPFFPGLNAPTDVVVSYFTTHTDRVLLAAFLQLGTAIPFGILAASILSRLRFLGVTAAGAHIAFFGGVAAAMDELFSGAVIATMAQPIVARDPALIQGLHYLAVALGGPGFTMPFGIMMAGMSVIGAFFKLLPKSIVTTGLVLAIIGELSWFSMILPSAGVLIPLCRWPGFIWLIATAIKLPDSVARPGGSI